jgi:hypothetical protein
MLRVVLVAPEARVRRLSAAEDLVQAALVLASDDVFCCVRGYFVAFSYGYVMSVFSANVLYLVVFAGGCVFSEHIPVSVGVEHCFLCRAYSRHSKQQEQYLLRPRFLTPLLSTPTMVCYPKDVHLLLLIHHEKQRRPKLS